MLKIFRIVGIAAFLGIMYGAVVRAEDSKNIALKISAETAENPFLLTFRLENHGAAVFETTPVGTNYSRIMIETADGRVTTHFFWKDFPQMIDVSPGDSMEWEIDLKPILEYRELNPKDQYVIYWDIEGVTSNRIILTGG